MINNDNFFYFTKDKNTVILIPLNPAMRHLFFEHFYVLNFEHPSQNRT